MNGASVVVVDDHPVVRAGIVALVATLPGFRVEGQAGTGPDAVELVGRIRPTLLVVDLILPGLSGFEVCRRAAASGTRVLVLTLHDDVRYVAEAQKNGALGYVLKDAVSERIVAAVRDVAAGRRHFPAPFHQVTTPAIVDAWDDLTPREREVFQCSAEGASYADIGARLGMSPRTAEVHRTRALRKLGLSTPTDVVRFAVKKGLLTLD